MKFVRPFRPMRSLSVALCVVCAMCAMLGTWLAASPDVARAEKAAPLLPETIFADTVWITPVDIESLGMGPIRDKDGKRAQLKTVAFFVSGHFMEQTSIDCEPGDTLKDVVIARAGQWEIFGKSATLTYEQEWFAQSITCEGAPREGVNIQFEGHGSRKTTGKSHAEALDPAKSKYAHQGMKMTLRAGETGAPLLMSTQSSAEAFLEDYLSGDIPQPFLAYFSCTTTKGVLACPRARVK